MGWMDRVNQGLEEEQHVWGLGTPESRLGHAENEKPVGYAQMSAGERSSRQLHVSKCGNFSTLRKNRYLRQML